MATAGIAPRFGIDVEDLRDLAQRPGPFLSVHLGTEPGVENAGVLVERRWKALRQRLAADGAPDAALDAVEGHVVDAHTRGGTLVVIADGDGQALHVEHLEAPIDEDRAGWAPLPDLLPLLASRQGRPPHLEVWADRGGADLAAHGFGVAPIRQEVGDDDPQRKVAPGGWSQSRYQNRADDDWARTAEEVADAVGWAAEHIGARVVVLGGDVRATQLIRERLPAEVAGRTYVVEPGRAADGSREARDEEVRRLVATAVAEDTVAVLEAIKEELGQHDRGVQGPDPTVDAANRAAIDLLLVADVGDDGRTAWVGAEPIPLGLGDTAATAVERPVRAPLTDALVRAALATGASVRVVPRNGPVEDGVGALLRWAAPPDRPN